MASFRKAGGIENITIEQNGNEVPGGEITVSKITGGEITATELNTGSALNSPEVRYLG